MKQVKENPQVKYCNAITLNSHIKPWLSKGKLTCRKKMKNMTKIKYKLFMQTNSIKLPCPGRDS